MSQQVQIIGQQRINEMLRQLNEIDSNKAIKAGLRKGVNLLRRAGISRLKSRMKNPSGVTGNLLKSFTTRVKKGKPGGLAGFTLIDSVSRKNKGAHAWLVDLGTAERSRNEAGSTGRMPALNYWTDTRNENMGGAIDEVLKGTEEAILKIMTK